MIVKIINTIWVFLILFFGGCSNNNEPGLDEFVNDLYQPRTVTNYQVSGKRDGATTQVFIQLPAMGELKIPTASSVQRSKKTSANT